jgi:hypothetical protein
MMANMHGQSGRRPAHTTRGSPGLAVAPGMNVGRLGIRRFRDFVLHSVGELGEGHAEGAG